MATAGMIALFPSTGRALDMHLDMQGEGLVEIECLPTLLPWALASRMDSLHLCVRILLVGPYTEVDVDGSTMLRAAKSSCINVT